jgi:cytochrome P450
MMPTFSFRQIKRHYAALWAKAHEMNRCLEDHLQKSAPDDSIELGEWAGRVTLDAIGITAMGHDFDSINDPHSELIKIYRSIFVPNRAAQVMWLLGFFLPSWALKLLPIKGSGNIRDAAEAARHIAQDLIRRKKLEQENQGKLTGSDFISLTLGSHAFTEEELVNQVMTLLGAGHDTTTASIVWAVYALCQNPSVQIRLREEIHTRIPPGTTDIDSALIDSLPYLHAVVNEVFRVYPSVPMTTRVAAHDTTILSQYIPKGTVIVTPPWAVNFSRELWGSDADAFKPERWLEPGRANSGGAESNFAFMSFSQGPRSCIGQGLARAELACFLARFVGRFKFELKDPNEKMVIRGPITPKPQNGLNLRIQVVDDWS